MERKTLCIVSHTHWDREWYLPFQRHRMRLVQLMDTLLHTLETNPEFESFHLDGQTILLEDYLEIRPENRERIRRLVQTGRIFVGPWYVLQDEYLTSGEANIRNMILGLRQARDFGPPVPVGYFPDSFGNVSQMPQILRGFGIDSAVFGRGVNPVGYGADGSPRGYHSELTWRSPDGSSVLGVFMANWYNNANEIPAAPEVAADFLRTARDRAARLATTPYLLLMNGSDHQPVQTNLPDVLREARERLEDEVRHTSIPAYVEALRNAVGELQVHHGELDSEYTKGWFTLTNTASARIYLKQLNQRAQHLLEREAEPLALLSWIWGKPYPAELLWRSWKYLLQNHPHDSICGCSIDAVHDEMETRFASSMQIAQGLVEESAHHLLPRIATIRFGDQARPVVVWNPLNWERSEMVEVDLLLPEDASLAGAVAADGATRVPVLLEDQGVAFHYELPEDRFRQTSRVHRYRARFYAGGVPGLGHKTFYIMDAPDAESSDAAHGGMDSVGPEGAAGVLENDDLRVIIRPNGALSVAHKPTGRRCEGVLVYEDCGDRGDEYRFLSPEDDRRITTEGRAADVRPIPAPGGESAYRIVHRLDLPAGLASGQPSRRREDTVPCRIETDVRLAAGDSGIRVRTRIVNRAENHRIRVLIPTGTTCDSHWAHGQFDVIRRSNEPWSGWENPSHCRKHEAFVALEDAGGGVAVANRGLPEYEVLDGGTVALTLLRCVGELGDWGVFPTPGAQCIGEYHFDFAVFPFGGSWKESGVYRRALAFSAPMRVFQASVHDGPLEDVASWIRVDGEGLVVSALKRAEHDNTVVLRLYNVGDVAVAMTVRTGFPTRTVHRTNLEEQEQESLPVQDRRMFQDVVGAKRISTYDLAPDTAPRG